MPDGDDTRWGLVGAGVGAAAGLVAAGVTAAVVAQRAVVGRARRAPDPRRDEPFGAPHGRSQSVETTDGAVLHVVVDDGPGPLTVVFVPGWALNSGSFHYQHRDLRGSARLVSYDQRGHGASSRGTTEPATIDLLGADLRAVLDQAVPGDGPVVLVGHSMGGMAILSLAGREPELFGTRVVGVALIGTSAGRLSEVTLGLPSAAARVLTRTAPSALAALGRIPGVVERGRAAAGDLTFLAMRHFGFGDRDASPAVIAFAESMVRATPIDVIARWYPALLSYDATAGLSALAGVPTLVVAATADRLTPVEHAEAIASACPSVHLLTIADCGHLIMLEQPELVNRALHTLLRRAAEQVRRREAT